MSAEEIKRHLLEKVETLTEQQLLQLNNYVDAIKQEPAKEYDLLQHVESIVKERKDVLKRLAQ